MTRSPLACALALGAALLSSPLLSPALAASALKLYPVRGLFQPADDAGLIHAAFREAVPAAGGGAYFQDEFRKAFPDAVANVADKDRRFTLVGSVQVARASSYTVDKVDGTTDVLAPVSGSLYFTNAVSGEVLYTVAATYYARATVARGGLDAARRQAMFQEAWQGLVAELLARARTQFKPRTVAATVKRAWNGLYLLDRGQDGGLAKGDLLSDAEGNTLEVVHAAPAYAVGAPSLGKIATGAAFAKETNADLNELKRPRVMVLVDAGPEGAVAGIPAEIVGQLFTDQLGAKAPLSVVQVNPLFSQVLETAFSSTALSNEHRGKRELPDYFLRLAVPESRSFELPSSLKNRSVRSYRTLATAELVDRSGRVIFATRGLDRSDDEVVAGMALDEASRREVSLKNALLDLAARIGKELKFEQSALALESTAPLRLQDRDGMLAPGAQLTLFRNIGRVDGIAGEVRMPFLDAAVDGVDGGAAQLGAGLPLTNTALAPAVGDLALVDSVNGVKAATRRRFAACGPAEQLGAVALPAFGELAYNSFANGYRAPYYSPAVFARVQALVGPEMRFKSRLAASGAPADYCAQAVYRIDPGPARCGGEPRVCQDSATVRITWRLRQGEQVVARSGLETTVTGAGYLDGTPAAARKNAFDSDLLDAAGKLAGDIAAGLNNQKFNSP